MPTPVTTPREPIWLSIARMSLDIREVPGVVNNPVIMRWAKDIGAPSWYDNDDKAWCAIFANRVLLAAGLTMAGTGFDLLRALSFAKWGVKLAGPALGAVAVFARPEGAHVMFYLGESPTAVYGIGGNQGNAVSAAWISRNDAQGRSRLLGYFWPEGVALPTIGPILLNSSGAVLSVNEA